MRTAKLLCFAAVAAVYCSAIFAPGQSVSSTANPVAEVRDLKSWEYGPFINWGSGVGDRSDFKFLWAGFELGKVVTPVVHASVLSGQFQLAGNVMPL